MYTPSIAENTDTMAIHSHRTLHHTLLGVCCDGYMYIHTVMCTHLFLSSSVPDLKENGILSYFYSFSGESRPGMEEKESRDK